MERSCVLGGCRLVWLPRVAGRLSKRLAKAIGLLDRARHHSWMDIYALSSESLECIQEIQVT